MKKLALTAFCVLFGASAAMATEDGFVLANDTNNVICFAFVSAVNEKNYGDDILGMADCLPIKGEAVIVMDTTTNPAWDLLIKDDMGNEGVYTNIDLQGIETLSLKQDGVMEAKKAAPKAAPAAK